jgi:hypothetical protein
MKNLIESLLCCFALAKQRVATSLSMFFRSLANLCNINLAKYTKLTATCNEIKKAATDQCKNTSNVKQGF